MPSRNDDDVALNLSITSHASTAESPGIHSYDSRDCSGSWKQGGEQFLGRTGLFIAASILPNGQFHRFRVKADTDPRRAFLNIDFEGSHPGAGICVNPPHYPERLINQGNVGRIFVYAGSSRNPPGPACGFPDIYRPIRGCPTPYGWLIEVDSGGTGSYDMTVFFYDGSVPFTGWSDQQDLGGILTTAPCVSSWAANRLDCFYRGQNEHMWHRWWDGNQWSAEEDLGGVLTSAPAAVSRAPNRIDCFYRGQNEHMWHRWWDGNQWSAEEDLGGVLASSPAVASWAANRLDCFYRGQNGHMWHRWWDGNQWSAEEDLNGVLVTNPASVSWGQGRIDCFYIGQNNHMCHRWYPR